MKKTELMDDGICTIDKSDEDGNVGCQVRRKIEDIHEQRRYRDELGEPMSSKQKRYGTLSV